MPPLRKLERSIVLDPSKIISQSLAASEVDAFLTWLFDDVVKKPAPLALRETAQVVRYLLRLVGQGIPKNVIDSGKEAVLRYQLKGRGDQEDVRMRNAVEHIGKVIWGDLLQFGSINSSSNSVARRFFSRHKHSWKDRRVPLALKFLDEYDLPPKAEDSFKPLGLQGGHLSHQGEAFLHLRDDLSERITTADVVLKSVNFKRRRARIVRVLSRAKIPMPTRTRSATRWTTEAVKDRIKAYHRQKHAIPVDALVNKWLSLFRLEQLTSPR